MSNEVAEVNENAITAPGDDPYLAYAESATAGGSDILKFRKGRYYLGIDEDEYKDLLSRRITGAGPS